MANILLIDDDEQIRSLLRRALEGLGHAVSEACDGEVGVRMFQVEPADLVITDILMPRKDGLQCLRELRQINPRVAIIVISGGMEQMDVLAAAKHFGAWSTLAKPFELKDLSAAVQDALDQRAA